MKSLCATVAVLTCVLGCVAMAAGIPALGAGAGRGAGAGIGALGLVTIQIDGQRVSVEVKLYLDRAPSGDVALGVEFTAATLNHTTLPKLKEVALRVTSLQGKAVWQPRLTVVPTPSFDRTSLVLGARGGPAVSPGARLSAVVEITSGDRLYRVVVPVTVGPTL